MIPRRPSRSSRSAPSPHPRGDDPAEAAYEAHLDGYAPRTGDTFAVLDATAVTGGFDAVEVTGLEPGWVFEIELVNGMVVVHSLTDGTVGTEPGGSGVPAASALHAAYPNPFNPQTIIPFDVAAAGHVRLAVNDLLGREVAVLVDEIRQAGRHEAVLDGRGLASGIYLVRMMTDGSFSQTRSVTLLR